MDKTITFKELKTKLLGFETITADVLGIDFKNLNDFIHPSSDLGMLVLLSKALKSGLKLENVNRERLLSSKSDDLVINVLDSGPFPEARYIEVSLDHLLKEGESYTYQGHSEKYGTDISMGAMIVVMDLAMDFEKQLQVHFSYPETPINTIDDLLEYLNNNQEEQIAIHKKRIWWQFWK